VTQQRSNTSIGGSRPGKAPVSQQGKPSPARPAAERTPSEKLAAVRAAAARPTKPPVAAKPPQAPEVPKAAAPAAPPARTPSRSGGQRHGFKTHDFLVYPAHGVGQIIAIEEQDVAGFRLELFVINFIKDKMTLRVPTSKTTSVGMRKLAEPDLMKKALNTLTGRARIKRTMWSRRAQEYEAKINSGDLVAIAEVVRDLYRSDAQPEQSYSERQLYEAALDRMARELSAVQKLTETEALKLIESQLQKGPRRGLKVEAESEAETEGEADESEGAVDEAA
jgi:CarD family transcriptional regulator